ncbi:MAG: hypothetical protein AAF217_08015 [Pseudomonadota bacterium]
MAKSKAAKGETFMDRAIEPYLEAESGDWRRFADMIEVGEPLPEGARKMIADYLRGESPPPKRRKRAQQRIEEEICYRVFRLMEGGASRAVAIRTVADETPRLTEDAIENYLRNWKSGI